MLEDPSRKKGEFRASPGGWECEGEACQGVWQGQTREKCGGDMRLLGEKGTERQDESFGAPISERCEAPGPLWGR